MRVKTELSVNNYVKLFIDEKIHFLFPLQKMVHIQSWKDSSNKFMLEISFEKGKNLLTSYDSKELWCEVLERLNERIK